MSSKIDLGGVVADVVRKKIKNVHLRVYPPSGEVRISAPLRMSLGAIRAFAVSKLAWIKRQQENIRRQERETPREYVDRERHYVWGKRYLLKVVEEEAAPHVEMQPSLLALHVRPGADGAKRQAVVARWYRDQIRDAVPTLIEKWEPSIGVTVANLFVQQMKTRWGSCNPRTRSIRLNAELAKRPPACVEYVVVHEMVHILEPSHNQRFKALMDRHMPRWREYRDALKRSPG